MSNSTIPILKFQFREDFRALKDALNIPPGYEVDDFNSANDMATYLSTTSAGLVISSLKTRDDLIQLATFMKVVKKIAKDTMIKVVVINFSYDKNFEKAIAKIGIQDIVEPGINTKALKFKLDFWVKSLNVQIKNTPSKDGSNVVKTNEPSKTGEKGKATDPTAPIWADPLNLENDIWLIKQENDAKKVLSKWLIRLLGPSPYVGQWFEVKSGLWRFDLKDHEREMYISGDGAWFFAGDQKPEFVWKENLWLISGDSFDLYFRDPNIIQSRLKAKDKALTVCKNSMFAKTKEQMIIESCDKELVFKREAENLDKMEGNNKTEQINRENLKGKSKTEQASEENLYGKSKTEQLNGGNLQGKTNTEQASEENLYGKSKTEQLNGGTLQGKTKSSTDKSGHLSGELDSSDRVTNDDLDQKTKTGKESSFWNGKNAYKKEEGKAEFGVKTDAVREGTLLDLEANTQELNKGPLGGKSSTDHMSSHYNNDRSEKDNKGADEKASGLMGKSSTDKIKSHYDNNNNKERSSSDKEKENRDQEHSGQMKNHANDRERLGFQEKDNSDLKGKSETDKLGGYYKNPKESGIQEPQKKDAVSKTGKLDEKESAFKDDENYYAKKTPSQSAGIGSDEEQSYQEEKNEEYFSGSKKDANSSAPKMHDSDKDPRKTKTFDETQKNSKTNEENSSEYTDDFKELIKKNRPERVNVAGQSAAEVQDEEENVGAPVLSLNRDRDDKAKVNLPEEARLDEISQDAKVTSVILSKGQKVECNLDDFFDNTIVFSTTDSQLDKNSKVTLNMSFNFLDKDTKLSMEGDIQEVEGIGDGTNYVTVTLSKDNIEAFNSFMKLFQARQKHITEFLVKAKGVA